MNHSLIRRDTLLFSLFAGWPSIRQFALVPLHVFWPRCLFLIVRIPVFARLRFDLRCIFALGFASLSNSQLAFLDAWASYDFSFDQFSFDPDRCLLIPERVA
jgi:hypothetical protein